MSVLTGPQIRAEIRKGNIVIDPYDEKNLNPNSYNLHLDKTLKVYSEMVGEPEEDALGNIAPFAPLFRLYTRDGGTVEVAYDLAPPVRDCTGTQEVPPCLDMRRANPTTSIDIPKTGIVLYPGVLYLANTVEHTETRYFAPNIEGRSSVARLGIQVHLTAGFGDNGFAGDWTLEILVAHPIRVYAGIGLCQISYTTLEGDMDSMMYKGKYQKQRGPKASMLWKDFLPKE